MYDDRPAERNGLKARTRSGTAEKDVHEVLTDSESAVRCAAHSTALRSGTERGAEAGSGDL